MKWILSIIIALFVYFIGGLIAWSIVLALVVPPNLSMSSFYLCQFGTYAGFTAVVAMVFGLIKPDEKRSSFISECIAYPSSFTLSYIIYMYMGREQRTLFGIPPDLVFIGFSIAMVAALTICSLRFFEDK